MRRSFFIGLALGSLIIILFNIALLLGVDADPVINEVVNFAWSAQVVTPSVVGRPTASFAWGSSIVFPDVVDHPSASLVWGSSIIPPCVIDEPNARLSSRVWVLNSSGLYTGSGALVTYPWVNCTYLVREWFVIVPAVAGANVSGYVDVNVSNPTLLQYLIKEPASVLITLDGSATPLKYYVYDVNATYIIYRVVLENVSDGPHILWVYAGGNGKYGYPGFPIIINYTGDELVNYTVLLRGVGFNEYIMNGEELHYYVDGDYTYINIPLIKPGVNIIYGRYGINGLRDNVTEFSRWVKFRLIPPSGEWSVERTGSAIRFTESSSSADWLIYGFTMNLTTPFTILANITTSTTQDGLHAFTVEVHGAPDILQFFMGRDDSASAFFPTGFGWRYVYDVGGNGWDAGGDAGDIAGAGTYPFNISVGSSSAIMTGSSSATLSLSIGSRPSVRVEIATKSPLNYVQWDKVLIINDSKVIDFTALLFPAVNGSTINALPVLYVIRGPAENRPSSCVVTATTTTTVKPNTAYVPPQSLTTPYVTWVSPPPYVTAGRGNGVHDVVERIRNAVVYLLRNPLILILLLMMLGGFLLIVGGSRRRY